MPQNCCINTGFWNVDHFGDTQCVTKLEHNIKSFLDYSFLSIGGWVDVVPPGSFAELKCVVCPGYTCGQVWQTSRTNLIWEVLSQSSRHTANHVQTLKTKTLKMPKNGQQKDFMMHVTKKRQSPPNNRHY